VQSELAAWKAEYARILKAVPEFASIAFEEYLRLAVLLCSRNFFCYNAPEPRLVVPLAGKPLSNPIRSADMFNHYMDKVGQTSWRYVPEEQSFAVFARQNIKRGEAVIVFCSVG
jgi:hypothetical protein